jgi:sulfur carrier protein
MMGCAPALPYGCAWRASFHQARRRTRCNAASTRVIGDNGGMDIQLNGQPLALPDRSTVATLLHLQGLAERRVAIEVNGEIIPRGQHAQHMLQADDRVEIVHALGGG